MECMDVETCRLPKTEKPRLSYQLSELSLVGCLRHKSRANLIKMTDEARNIRRILSTANISILFGSHILSLDLALPCY